MVSGPHELWPGWTHFGTWIRTVWMSPSFDLIKIWDIIQQSLLQTSRKWMGIRASPNIWLKRAAYTGPEGLMWHERVAHSSHLFIIVSFFFFFNAKVVRGACGILCFTYPNYLLDSRLWIVNTIVVSGKVSFIALPLGASLLLLISFDPGL